MTAMHGKKQACARPRIECAPQKAWQRPGDLKTRYACAARKTSASRHSLDWWAHLRREPYGSYISYAFKTRIQYQPIRSLTTPPKQKQQSDARGTARTSNVIPLNWPRARLRNAEVGESSNGRDVNSPTIALYRKYTLKPPYLAYPR